MSESNNDAADVISDREELEQRAAKAAEVVKRILTDEDFAHEIRVMAKRGLASGLASDEWMELLRYFATDPDHLAEMRTLYSPELASGGCTTEWATNATLTTRYTIMTAAVTIATTSRLVQTRSCACTGPDC